MQDNQNMDNYEKKKKYSAAHNSRPVNKITKNRFGYQSNRQSKEREQKNNYVD